MGNIIAKAETVDHQLQLLESHHPLFRKVQRYLFLFILLRVVCKTLWLLYDKGPFRLVSDSKKSIVLSFFRSLKKIPFVQAKIAAEMGKVMVDVEKDLEKPPQLTKFLRLPEKGLSKEDLLQLVNEHKNVSKVKWEEGKISGTVYYGFGEINEVANYASNAFSLSNPLHPDVFPGVNKMEAEVVSMVLQMYNATPDSCGTMTSGGTESILMSCKAHRDWARDVKGITQPEIVAAVSVHAAFDKACGYFGIQLIHVPVDEETRKIDLRAARNAITSNTIMIVGSVPSFPHGACDDIQQLSEIALNYGIGLHVDCCLGGFLVPFMEKAGFPLPPFDFRVPGVTSISCDPHKYGFTPKGSSVVMYASKSLRHYQYFVAPDWTGGIYASPSIAGSRAGSLIAGCWASMMYMGEGGYVNSTTEIIKAAKFIQKELSTVHGIFVFGQPEVSVVALGSKIFDIYRLNKKLGKRGWNLNALQFPSSIHLCVTYMTTKVAGVFVTDVQECTEKIMRTPDKKSTGSAAIYGMSQALPDRSLVDYIAKGFIDALYKP